MSSSAEATSLTFVFDRVTSEYSELSDLWKQIDVKAQSTATVAGIFVAAAFAFIRNTAHQANSLEKALLSAAMVALVLSIILSVRAMLVRSVPMPPEPENIAGMVKEVLARPEAEHERRHAALLGDTIDSWLPVNRELRAGLATKAGMLIWGQRALLGAAVVMGLLTVIAIWGKGAAK